MSVSVGGRELGFASDENGSVWKAVVASCSTCITHELKCHTLFRCLHLLKAVSYSARGVTRSRINLFINRYSLIIVINFFLLILNVRLVHKSSVILLLVLRLSV